jgi:hypothetical protein
MSSASEPADFDREGSMRSNWHDISGLPRRITRRKSMVATGSNGPSSPTTPTGATSCPAGGACPSGVVTTVHRKQAGPDTGGTQAIDIELVALSLVSVAPVDIAGFAYNLCPWTRRPISTWAPSTLGMATPHSRPTTTTA